MEALRGSGLFEELKEEKCAPKGERGHRPSRILDFSYGLKQCLAGHEVSLGLKGSH